MIFVKNSRGGREVNMINTLSKINLSKIGWEGGRSTSVWIMSLNILLFLEYPLGIFVIYHSCYNILEMNKSDKTVTRKEETNTGSALITST